MRERKDRGNEKGGYIPTVTSDHNIKPPEIICRLGWLFIYYPFSSHIFSFYF